MTLAMTLAERLALWRSRAAEPTYVDRFFARRGERAESAQAGDDAGIDCPGCGSAMLVLAVAAGKTVVGCPTCEQREER